jgi:MFS family permease
MSAGAVGASLSIFLAGFAVGNCSGGRCRTAWGASRCCWPAVACLPWAALGMFWVETAPLLLSLRFIQAIGICAAAVTWQALVIDRYPADKANRVFAGIMPLMGLSPALAPLLGAVVLGHLGWQAIFAVLLGLALLLIVPTLLLKEPPRVASRAVKARVSYWQLLSTATFSGNVMIFAACSASFFAWLTASPFILGDMGYSPSDIGLSYALPTVAFMVGGYSCRSALQRISGRALLPWLLVAYRQQAGRSAASGLLLIYPPHREAERRFCGVGRPAWMPGEPRWAMDGPWRRAHGAGPERGNLSAAKAVRHGARPFWFLLWLFDKRDSL